MSRSAIVGIVVLALCGVAVALLLRNPRSVPAPIPATATDLELTGYDTAGMIAWVVRADGGSYNDPTSTLSTPEIIFYRDNQPHITVRGEQLTRTPSFSSIAGETTIEREDGFRLISQDVRWDEQHEVLESAQVRIEMAYTDLSAGGFHYDMNASQSSFSNGVALHVDHEGQRVRAVAETAEEANGWLSLIGGVEIETSSDALYRCERLDSTLDGKTIRMSGPVSGEWPSGSFSAVTVELERNGSRAQGDVRVRLNLRKLGEDHGA